MIQRSLMASIGASVSIAAFAAFAGAANAQSALGGCDATTGLGSNGQPCVELTPLDPNRIVGGAPDATGGDQYRTLDTSTLGQTYACRQVDAANGVGQGGTLLFEDCGTPLTGAELGELKPFYGTTGAPAPAPVYTPPPPQPVVAVAPPPPPPPPVIAAPAIPVAAPSLGFAGLGNAGIIAAGVGAAALIGIAAVALDDDDSSSSSSN